MTYNLDERIDRRGTNSLKWDYGKRYTGRDEELLPLWVADMDFRAPEFLTRALTERIAHGIFGYAPYPPSYFDAVRLWLRQRHGWEVEEEWIVPVPGVVPAIRLALECLTRPGEKIVIQPPVYYPFSAVISRNGRRIVENPLKRVGRRYEMDFEQLEGVVDEETRAFLLCSPHNPVARVWTGEELESLRDFCLAHELVLISDEIHCDLIMGGSRHIPAATLYREGRNPTITFTSATKTFNLSGLSCANAIIPDATIRRAFSHQVAIESLQLPNLMSVVAAEAAYRGGSGWLDQTLAYIEENYRFLVSFLGERAPDLVVFPLEGTYLVWIDLSATGIPDAELKKRLLDEGVWLDDGPMFGTGGQGFQRINIACPKSILEEALERLVRALS